ncbi:MAG: hypothetical protein AAFR61_10480 [Bacteroidota bacterium]
MKRIISQGVAIFMGLAGLGLLPTLSFAQSQEVQFLNQHHQTFSVQAEGVLPSLSLLDPYLQGPEIILAGEQHYLKESADLRFFFLRYTHQHAGVRYLLEELPFSMGYLLNQYVLSGDSSYLNRVFPHYSTPQRFKAWRSFYQKLAAFNQRLPLGDKIQVIGLDVERMTEFDWMVQNPAFRLLRSMLAQHQVPIGKVADLYSCMGEMENYPFDEAVSKQVQSRMRSFVEYWYQEWDSFHEMLGEDFFAAHIMITGLHQSWQYPGDKLAPYRDDFMYQSFRLLYPTFAVEARCFGQFGSIHTPLEAGKRPLGTQLQQAEHSPVRGRTLSIRYAYEGVIEKANANPRGLYREGDLIRDLPKRLQAPCLEAFSSAPQPILIQLDGLHSPFTDQARQFSFMVYVPLGVQYQNKFEKE